ncbi:methyl-accepting chemotaxis protein [Clostridium acetobutylicum]|uniref:Possible membrane-associated methyl-accepting chemotaxis protein fused to HAMP domain n=1 Tax=Clostridium acetobutylicum (strain ATCC 824 / DSM 792 / JCM 1419 / IAM 19013 / LMG 5710 / NBRC 13948 / NRRL B-527 / VKM B-1787 / 2291 / W) TaxID=272562 RepID=Q97G25_CLOAB|nr:MULTISPECIES: methyl-accepting chemotaxis protein [Clostridium]AAK80498.1 Possible membrane-associated methyl-accepting chemotaxis protein fused to HAMP domain [Clostridium acetobutylicum ATCC 824]ADZ21597.1 putative membrane-associated methyl-accepting chemotaxis protein fused to HAMP domain [Clostridium acetobutylicum EA 2018]AEI34366.1 membrane-associated methyl-accepting chemotaxis protein [Clostridium acetobutylicum DSM 1731]AWV79084.1 HAMP domain-containing protein [Clostridium acetobu
MQFKRASLNSIRSKLIISLISICVIPLLIIGTFSYNYAKSILNSKLNVTSTQTLNEVNDGLINYFHGLSDIISMTAKNPPIINIDSDNNTQLISEILGGVKNSDNDILDAYYGTASGKFIMYPDTKMPDGFDATTRDWYKRAVASKGEVIITPPFKDVVTGNMVVGIAKAVEKDGKVVGVIGIDCTLSTLADKIATKKIGNSGYVFIANGDGIILAHPNKSIINTNEAGKLPFWGETKTKDSGFVTYTYKDIKKFGVYKTNKLTGWKVVATLEQSELTSDTKSILLTTSIIVLIMALVAAVLSLVLSKGIANNINKLKDVFAKASNGDLSNFIEVKTKDEFGQLARDYNSMIKNIGMLLSNAKKTSNTVLDTTSSLSSMAEETLASMSQVALAVSEISTAAVSLAENSGETANGIGELSTKLDDVAGITEDMSNVSSDTKNLSKQGINTVSVLISKNSETMEASMKVFDIVSDMDNSVKEISTISDAINEITEQTNLLSLNASIEAARAGEAGKGFAVVADEIRKLAEQSKASTEQIKLIIENIQEKANTAVKAMDSNKNINLEQNKVVEKTEQIFNDILMSITNLTEKVDNVKMSVESMQTQKQEFVAQVENTSAISEETASSIEEVTASTEEVTATMDKFTQHTVEVQELAEKLKEEIYKFKV